MKKPRWMVLMLVLLAVFSLGLAACGDDNGDGDEDEPVVTVAPTQEVVEPADDMTATEAAGDAGADMAATEEMGADMAATEAAGDAGADMAATEEAGAAGADAGAEDTMTGDPGNGETLFTSNCAGCHDIETGEDGTGPTLRGIANVADERVPDMSAVEYLHESMVEPGAHVVEGFENIMPAFDQLPEEDLADLVAFMMTLDE